MGHVISPVSYRLYNLRYWSNNWFVFNKGNFSYLNIQDILFAILIKKLIYKYLKGDVAGIIINNIKTVRQYDKIYLCISFHDSYYDYTISDFWRKNLWNFKKKIFKNYRYKFFKNTRNSYNEYIRTDKMLKLIPKVKKRLSKRGTFLNFFNRYYFRAFAKRVISYYIKKNILKSFWSSVKSLIFWYLSKFNINTSNLEIKVVSLSKNNVTANVIAEYFYIRLKQYYTIWEILRSVNFFLKQLLYKRKIIRGYKITCAGRFSRKQRASYTWKIFGRISPNSMKSRLDYTYRSIALKYSSCSVKVWISLRKIKLKKKIIKKRIDYIL